MSTWERYSVNWLLTARLAGLLFSKNLLSVGSACFPYSHLRLPKARSSSDPDLKTRRSLFGNTSERLTQEARSLIEGCSLLVHSASGRTRGNRGLSPPGMLYQKTHKLQMFPLDLDAVRSLYLCYENSYFPTFTYSLLPFPDPRTH